MTSMASRLTTCRTGNSPVISTPVRCSQLFAFECPVWSLSFTSKLQRMSNFGHNHGYAIFGQGFANAQVLSDADGFEDSVQTSKKRQVRKARFVTPQMVCDPSGNYYANVGFQDQVPIFSGPHHSMQPRDRTLPQNIAVDNHEDVEQKPQCRVYTMDYRTGLPKLQTTDNSAPPLFVGIVRRGLFE